MNGITDMSLCALVDALDGKKLSAAEATRACLDRIKATEDLNNFITVCEDEALKAAAAADARRKAGERGGLLGVPIAVKDNISTRGVKTTCASAFLSDYVPPFDATAVDKLKAAGAVIVGKTNMDEFAMGSTNENSHFGAAHNAADVTRVTGGSSGGSANAVASRQVFAALGSDTGGSIRQPASYCGTVGLKPTYSAVSRYGLIAFASSLDQIGPFARTSEDALRVLGTIAGKDSRDSTSTDKLDLPDKLAGKVKGRTFGVADELLSGAASDVKTAFERTIALLEDNGAKIKKVKLGSVDAALAV